MDKKKPTNGKIYKTIADEIERMIVEGVLQPGDKLSSLKELAEQFGVSRAAVREAFSSLQGKGLIELRHGTGTFVAHAELEKRLFAPLHAALLIGRNDLISLHEVRTILEVGASRWAAANRTAEAYEEIAVALTEFEWASNDTDLARADLRFHQAIANATGNMVIQNLLTTLTESLYEVIHATLPLLPYVEVIKDYREWAETIREGRPEQASRVAERYLHKIGSVIEKPIRFASNKSDT